MKNNQLIALKNIVEISPYIPGKPISELRRELKLSKSVKVIKLASNENPLGASPKSLLAIQKSVNEISRYPDGNAFALKQAICKKFAKYKISENQIVIGNGSNDILDLAARIFITNGDKVVFSQYCFAVYPLVTKSCNATAIEVPVKNDFSQDLPEMAKAVIKNKAKVVFLANPNNPTGVYSDMSEVKKLIASIPSTCAIILDEAYCEYLADKKKQNLSLSLLKEFPNLIITRTFSKIYGLGGLRVGFSLCSPQIADWMNRLRQPFNVNSLAIEAARAAINDDVFISKSRKKNAKQITYLEKKLSRLGLTIIPSSANFVVFEVDNAGQVNLQLMKKGIIVRPLLSYGLTNYIRVTAGLASENKRFIKALSIINN